MPLNIAFELNETHLLCLATGRIETSEELYQFNTAMVQAVEKTGLRRILLDMQKSDSSLDYHDVLTAENRETSDRFAMGGIRIAAVVSPHRLKAHQLYETMAINRSIVYKAFSGKQQALDWLHA
ncbi:hypothetical protein [uncultured Pseudodesulfovibrio sp.]|uniref:hypothetical protein n=1 Tax=uncultured Pseudodesulfovibrio sp. TaxID=2035858 RepID=UPI0029C7F101|nr:hypothetical protein [uncultured Pseudodesulfovibrio sp.]